MPLTEQAIPDNKPASVSVPTENISDKKATYLDKMNHFSDLASIKEEKVIRLANEVSSILQVETYCWETESQEAQLAIMVRYAGNDEHFAGMLNTCLNAIDDACSDRETACKYRIMAEAN